MILILILFNTPFFQQIASMHRQPVPARHRKERHRKIRGGFVISTKYLHIQSIDQCLASSELLTPPPPTLSPPSECVLPPHHRRGVTHSPGGEGVGVNISEDARHWIGHLQFKPSTLSSHGNGHGQRKKDVWFRRRVYYSEEISVQARHNSNLMHRRQCVFDLGGVLTPL